MKRKEEGEEFAFSLGSHSFHAIGTETNGVPALHSKPLKVVVPWKSKPLARTVQARFQQCKRQFFPTVGGGRGADRLVVRQVICNRLRKATGIALDRRETKEPRSAGLHRVP